MLTRKQHQLLLYIDDHLKRTGFSPSFDEMKDALELRSKSGIHRLISALEERGFLRRHHHRARALEVVKMPPMPSLVDTSNLGANADPALGGHSNVVQARFGSAAGAAGANDVDGPVSLPLYGRIAAGLPIEALRENGDHIQVPANLLGHGAHYALEVSGDSMIEAGILDGDIVLIRQGDVAENGQIIVALIDGQEVTLKRLRRHGNSIALEPANASYETRIFPSDRVRIQGRLVGLYRRYD
ncbi:transcriptional repressor LexA [Kozakia baliensis]|uniref:LexA repressor n=1 Tax=Kozakia baliensis TaxID=153496 RepID=A0A1D8UT91_9PROT|nr:transcriptional repressor LexA [Kozakia baliensis]AOX16852.1 repressor LexA [Kozakia baliensis]GBR24445.1 LexA repressor [Kozakia baliensis NRIC 0488]GEL64748.1 LexA repressor [Kozakia baliensis]